uniref:Uncharacterized protein n=1 Tax=Timspurckia oligopyrenoides TaxID=708627 RepID=A0A7S0ZIS6_9RHOD|mmetsp:Transcript_6969/g.12493  ORF Transcript_6969/g.12493 Transcript_6969/m.12493 type:complete len:519 (+) Transcript_6969:188-1744(+)|eukprot:CAMPEP_0182445982 /NCGR_PEP_ID=MMETSP1172-20130603/3903_1 /TAXON_ID=708627 /ORGANISM="Timspurckia oligopyrenoides, Strain CCMP3278" /LENGTH=518 /DNA_ID=CAMNT_0024641835 /DNA_START=369 /DNA_END=1925 /DNA_ORIENTATION=-
MTESVVDKKEDGVVGDKKVSVRRLKKTTYSNVQVFQYDRMIGWLLFIGILVVVFLVLYRLNFFTSDEREVNQNDGSMLMWGVMLDAGSTGTRAHICQFLRTRYGEYRLLFTNFVEVQKGFSSLIREDGDHVEEVKSILSPIIDVLNEKIAPEHTHWTPIFLRATAGLRLLSDRHSEKILTAAFKCLRKTGYLTKRKWVSILDGTLEAVFNWITVNYVFHSISSRDPIEVRMQKSVGALDLGGGSLQLAFVPDLADIPTNKQQKEDPRLNVSDFIHETAVFPTRKVLYAHSFLGYGILDFQRKLYEHLQSTNRLLENPCFYSGHRKHLKTGLLREEIDTLGSGNFHECLKEAKAVFGLTDTENMLSNDGTSETCAAGDDGTECSGFQQAVEVPTELCVFGRNSCGIDGKYQPIPRGKLVAFAYFYDKIQLAGLGESPSRAEIFARGEQICSLNHSDAVTEFGDDADSLCGDLAYIYVLLFEVIRIGKDVDLKFIQRVGGSMLGWGIGALIAAMETSKIQ